MKNMTHYFFLCFEFFLGGNKSDISVTSKQEPPKNNLERN